MSKNQTIYNQVAAFASSNVSSGFSFLDSNGQLVNDFNLSTFNLVFPIRRVTEVSYSFTLPRTDIKAIGFAGTLGRPILNPPDVSLSLSYYQAGIINELRLGLLCNYPRSGVIGALPLYSNYVSPISGLTDRNYDRSQDFNINWPPTTREPKNLSIATKRNYEDLNDFNTGIVYKSTDVDCFSFGDCYLNSWKTSCQVGQIPQCSVNFISSNIIFYSSGSGLNIPSLNPQNNTLRSGILFNLPNTFEGNNLPTVLLPKDINLTILPSDGSNADNLPIDFNDIKIQGYDISLDLSREPLNSLGYKLPLDRRINSPAFASLNFNVIAGDNYTGSVLGNIKQDKEYNIKIKLNYQPNQLSGITAVQYDFIGAKFNGMNLSESISQRRGAGFSFTTELIPNNTSKGFFISGQLGIPQRQVPFSNSGFLLDTSGDYLLYEDGSKFIIDGIDLTNSILY